MRHAVRRLLPVLLLGPVLAVGLAAPALAQPTSTGAGGAETRLSIPGLPRLSPPGANDFSCTPDAAHPYPVVLVHGTFADAYGSWLSLSPQLAAEGYCVFALDYGRNATIAIERSAGQLADFVDRVLEATGAAKVSLVGHSQGGLMPRYYLRFLGGAALVDELIGLAPSNRGTTVPILPGTGLLCRACVQQQAGSAFLTELNAGREVEPGVDYTVLVTRYDEVVVPFRSGYLAGPAAQVTNVTLQDRCPLDRTDHVLITYDPVAADWVEHALGRDGPASRSYQPAC